MRSKRVSTNTIGFGLIVAVIVLLFGGSAALHFGTIDTVTGVEVTEKERITTKSGDRVTSKYLIFTDREVFENTDSFLAFKFNSSDSYGRIKVGQVCTFKVTGFRIPFLSSYRNILEARCVDKE